MIFEQSRYEFTDVENFPDMHGGQRQTICATAVAAPALRFTYDFYFCKQGDRIDLLASKFIGNSEKWWVIAECNPHWIFYDYLPAGLKLRIPHGIPIR